MGCFALYLTPKRTGSKKWLRDVYVQSFGGFFWKVSGDLKGEALEDK